MAIDIFDTLQQMEQERYRVIIIHTSPDNGPSLSLFCKKVSIQTDGQFIDLLDYFIQTPDFSKNLDLYNPEKFRGLLLDLCSGRALLVIDRADFLIDTWRKAERQSFFRLINNQWDSYKEGMKAQIVFALQTSQEIEALNIIDSHNQSRIFHIHDFNDLA